MALDSLSIEINGKGKTEALLKRSCLVVFAVLSLIVVVSFLPHTRSSKRSVENGSAQQSRDADACSAEPTLMHLHILHRHGMQRVVCL